MLARNMNGGKDRILMMAFLLLAVISPLALVAAFSRSGPRALTAGQLLVLALVPLWLVLELLWVALAQLLLAALVIGWLQWRARQQRGGQA